MAQKRRKSKLQLGPDGGRSGPAGNQSGPMNGASQPQPGESAELDAAGQALRNAAERHGQATQRACFDALSSVLEAANDEAIGTDGAVQRVKSVAEKLTQATRNAEINLR